MISIVICEDDEIHRKILCTYISKTLDKNSYRLIEFSSGEELLMNYPLSISILLLDVQMSGVNGLDTAREIRKFDTNVNIIFTTGIIDFIQQGYEVKAFRYLLKPIKYQEFSRHLLECIEEIKENNSNYLAFKDTDLCEIIRIPINIILYIETESRFILIHTDNKIYRSTNSLNKLEKQLIESKFYRCHRSYLINLSKVRRIKTNTVTIRDKEVLVSRYKMKNLKLKLTKELGDMLC
ncbi:LytR/AlgR family response regulator transcription factor [Metaclostridioides mangenotii]|uniref:LytR/AlgR family response regulator transcription factor n=1 Tax=Metaclostridioides mangenotii TaxID=1540 RepID=UPI0004675BDC|nr:LytTR family DNA-binding domain-containing protein [Clostridioides mangenotii]